MINSVSSLSFRGEAAPVSSDIINAPSKFAAPMDSKPDAFEKAGEKGGDDEKKSKLPAILGSILALAAITYVALGVAVNKGKLEKVVAAEGKELKFTDKIKNFFHSIGENADNMWKKIRGKKAEGEAKPDANTKPTDTPEAPKGEAPKGETPSTDGK